ncbi:TetR/AcrR family transcriptional regulator [Tenggerimyces flavus]|uniref:TetR/AcrR family transcriptional regulator n=1 Tax=Tenggerimyces flavus TaxID=1708749 RepID=A0ABV7YPP7_9ACTN|nr:TetR/AcrR family transcriptional regulator [Tenggerimyces flavus]MBM7784378.1 AcrR family transcriptional regulator [Tenggerimyces flavus]
MSQREDLLAAAKKLLVDKGYHRTTARDIATASGSHLASIGYHYGSKDALMTAAALEAQNEWGDAIDTAMAADGADAADRLSIAVDRLTASMAAQREVLVASIQTYAQAAYDDDIRSTLSAATAGARRNLAAGILGTEPENVDDDTTRSLGSVVHALIAGLSLQAFLDPATLPTGAQVAAAMRAITKEE